MTILNGGHGLPLQGEGITLVVVAYKVQQRAGHSLWSGATCGQLRESLHFSSHHIDTSFIGGVQLEDSLPEHVSKELPGSCKDRAGKDSGEISFDTIMTCCMDLPGFAGSWGSIE